MKKIAANRNYRVHKIAQEESGAGCEKTLTLLQELAPLIRDLHRSMAEAGNAPSQRAGTFQLPAMEQSQSQVATPPDQLSREELDALMDRMLRG